MSRLLLIAALVGALFSTSSTQTAEASQGWAECTHHIPDMASLPYEPPNSVRICRDGVIAISFDKVMYVPSFAMYYVTPEQARNLLPGRETFFQDPDLKAMGVKQAAVTSKAFSNDWNRGHLAPSHLLSYSAVSKKAVYTMANIAPQGGYFNQHPWEAIESLVAKWIANNKALYLATGVSYKNRAAPTRTADDIAVPDFYWKVLCEPISGQTVGFFGVNAPDTKVTTDFVTVAQIEKMYGGKIFNTPKCKTTTVNKSFWW